MGAGCMYTLPDSGTKAFWYDPEIEFNPNDPDANYWAQYEAYVEMYHALCRHQAFKECNPDGSPTSLRDFGVAKFPCGAGYQVTLVAGPGNFTIVVELGLDKLIWVPNAAAGLTAEYHRLMSAVNQDLPLYRATSGYTAELFAIGTLGPDGSLKK